MDIGHIPSCNPDEVERKSLLMNADSSKTGLQDDGKRSSLKNHDLSMEMGSELVVQEAEVELVSTGQETKVDEWPPLVLKE